MVERPSFFVSYSTIVITKKINTEEKHSADTYFDLSIFYILNITNIKLSLRLKKIR